MRASLLKVGLRIGSPGLLLSLAACTVLSAAAPEDAAAPDAAGADAARPLAPPVVTDPGPQQVEEERTLALSLSARGAGGGPVRVFVSGLPEGAHFDAGTQALRFTPDFTQGGRTWPVTVTAIEGDRRTSLTFSITALDTIRPPAPQVTASQTVGAWRRLTVTQRSDAFLDSPGYAGRDLGAIVTAPLDPSGPPRLPVRVLLHGFDGAPARDGWEGEIRIMPADPMNSYWWGYGDRLPAGSPDRDGGTVPPYTQRRVLNLLDWVLRTFPAADPERVYLDGASMGGAGAMALGLLSARHFCWVQASLGQAIARNHRPARVTQLSTLWGRPERNLPGAARLGVWDLLDLTRVLVEVPEAREQFLFLRHGKDDTTIHFGAMVLASPRTRVSFYEALQREHGGHLLVWDEGGHGPKDPVLPEGWWQSGWNPVFDDTAYLRRHQVFPAFSRCSTDRDPGSGKPNGRQSWDDSGGYAGKLEVPGDTGWDGELAGARNRGLRWDARRAVDTIERLELPLRVLDGSGAPPPRPGYPTIGDKLDGALPVRVDVTPRRVQRFQCRPGEKIGWELGAQRGSVTAGSDGAVTVPGVELGTAWQTLILRRAEPL
ncbi:MAG: hypothetical protein U1A78_02815 [Polyangia bacterium]